MKPGAAVLWPRAAEKTAVLLRTCAAVLASLGHSIPPNPPEPFVDQKINSRDDFLQTQRRLLPVFAPLREKFGLDDYQASRAAAVATALTAHTVCRKLEVTRGFAIAAFGFIEGSQTVPALHENVENVV
jgi:hypothetical protein